MEWDNDLIFDLLSHLRNVHSFYMWIDDFIFLELHETFPILIVVIGLNFELDTKPLLYVLVVHDVLLKKP